MTNPPGNPAPGWYPTPDGTQHWWDGTQWTASAPPPPGMGVSPGGGVPNQQIQQNQQFQQEKTLAIVAHIGPVIAGFIAPLIVWIVVKDDQTKSEWVRHHAREALNFQLSLLIYGVVLTIVGIVLTIVTLGLFFFVLIPLFVLLAFGTLIFSIIATVKANRGEWYQYPATIRLLT